ncbi:hypothetical protein C2G38_2210583 [Gigaspora rosea]|uniref:Uncharacterized protein n=1 Tax=Gigaspora rosea TaxID=44941 RepID=A0A397UN85_9GLOM|nr:hypothetical protein C2G38_2210583 [Gigaspora rosea]
MENTALSAACVALSDEAKLLLSPWDLGKILLSDIREIRYKKREIYLDGFVEMEKFDLLYRRGFTKKESRGCIDAVLYMVQESFYCIIWKKRCKEVIKWKKEIGIERTLKRKQGDSSVCTKAPPMLELIEDKRSEVEQKKQKKQKQAEAVNNLVKNSILCQIMDERETLPESLHSVEIYMINTSKSPETYDPKQAKLIQKLQERKKNQKTTYGTPRNDDTNDGTNDSTSDETKSERQQAKK